MIEKINIHTLSKLLLIGMFLFTIFVPPLKTLIGLKKVVSQGENRKLASIPKFSMNARSIKEFSSEFENYYEDNFGFRGAFVYLNSLIKVYWLNISAVPKVITGKDDWLFWTGEELIEDYRGLITLSSLQLETWREELEYKYKWLEKHKIRYLYVVVPDKQTIYPEYLPDSVNKVQKKTKLDQLLEYLKSNSKFKIFDMRDPLMEAKKRGLLFFPRDSHWNVPGALIAYKSIMKQVLQMFPNVNMVDFNISDYEENHEIISMKSRGMESTLGLFFSPVPGWTLVSTPGFKLKKSCAVTVELFKKNKNPDEFSKVLEPFAKSCPKAKLRAIVIRDSMFTDVEPFLSENFQLILYLWPMQRWKAYEYKYDKYIMEMIEKIKPDIVIEERGERMLFDGVPADKYHFYHGTSFLKSGKIDRAVIQFNEAIRLNPNYSKAHYNLGITLEKQNKTADAAEQYDKVLMIDDDYAEAHNNLGCVLFRMKNVEKSIFYFRRALRIKSNYPDAQKNLETALKAVNNKSECSCISSKIEEYW
jgi:tetratricopeptide (TPR) repeat protein